MSAKEVDRLHWMRLLAERRTTQRQAAEALGLTARHLRRLCAAFEAAGAPGLVSKRRGKRSNRAAPDAMRDQVVGIVRTLAHARKARCLLQRQGFDLSCERQGPQGG